MTVKSMMKSTQKPTQKSTHRLWQLALAFLLTAVVGSSLMPLPIQAATMPAARPQAEAIVVRELAFTNGDVQLSGTLYLPSGAGPFPAAVLMHGAGPDSREPYIPDAEMLVSHGIAAFIFDKRGTGDSTGDWRRSSLDDLMGDGLAAVALLQAQPEIASDKVGLLGVSQGAWLSPFMAARSDAVAFIIQVTGSATSLAAQEMWDDGNSLQELGFSDLAIATQMKALHLLYSSRGLIQRGILPLDHLWFVHYDPTLDPATAWPQVRVPVLSLFGGQDSTVPTVESLQIVQDALAQNGDPQSRVVVFPDLGHALAGRNQNAEYTALVGGWIQAVTNGPENGTGNGTGNGTEMPPMPFSATYTPPAGLRWYGVGAGTTPFYATAPFQLPLILIFLLTFVVAVAVSLLPWVKLGGTLSRLAMGLLGITNTVLLVGLLNAINFLLNADADAASPPVPLGNWLMPLGWLSVITLGLLAYAWQRTQSTRRQGAGRALVIVILVVAVAFIPFLAYWEVFSGRF